MTKEKITCDCCLVDGDTVTYYYDGRPLSFKLEALPQTDEDFDGDLEDEFFQDSNQWESYERNDLKNRFRNSPSLNVIETNCHGIIIHDNGVEKYVRFRHIRSEYLGEREKEFIPILERHGCCITLFKDITLLLKTKEAQCFQVEDRGENLIFSDYLIVSREKSNTWAITGQ